MRDPNIFAIRTRLFRGGCLRTQVGLAMSWHLLADEHGPNRVTHLLAKSERSHMLGNRAARSQALAVLFRSLMLLSVALVACFSNDSSAPRIDDVDTDPTEVDRQMKQVQDRGESELRFLSVSAGSGHNCGITIDGVVTCWGANYSGQATPPEGTFLSVSAGGHHTCDVTTTGDAVCWGHNQYGQSMPRAGTFLSISAGNYHTCGITTDRSIAC